MDISVNNILWISIENFQIIQQKNEEKKQIPSQILESFSLCKIERSAKKLRFNNYIKFNILPFGNDLFVKCPSCGKSVALNTLKHHLNFNQNCTKSFALCLKFFKKLFFKTFQQKSMVVKRLNKFEIIQRFTIFYHFRKNFGLNFEIKCLNDV